MSDVLRPSRAADHAHARQEIDRSADGSALWAYGAIESRAASDTSYDVAWPGAAPFEVRVQPDRERVIVELRGELDLAAIPQLREQCDELLGAGFRHLVLDLRELAFIDSTGLNLLIELYAGARRDGWELALIPGSDAVHRVFVVSGTVEYLPFTSATALHAKRH